MLFNLLIMLITGFFVASKLLYVMLMLAHLEEMKRLWPEQTSLECL